MINNRNTRQTNPAKNFTTSTSTTLLITALFYEVYFHDILKVQDI